MAFTIVFEGDLRKFEGNPLKTETPFGVPMTVAVGDVFEERDALETERDELKHDIERHLQIISETLAERDGLVKALDALLFRYVQLVECGDCGFWDQEKEPEVINARAALSALNTSGADQPGTAAIVPNQQDDGSKG